MASRRQTRRWALGGVSFACALLATSLLADGPGDSVGRHGGKPDLSGRAGVSAQAKQDRQEGPTWSGIRILAAGRTEDRPDRTAGQTAVPQRNTGPSWTILDGIRASAGTKGGNGGNPPGPEQGITGNHQPVPPAGGQAGSHQGGRDGGLTFGSDRPDGNRDSGPDSRPPRVDGPVFTAHHDPTPGPGLRPGDRRDDRWEWTPDHRWDGRPHGYYEHRDGRWHERTEFGIRIIVGLPPFGAVLTTLPRNCIVVWVGGVQYYWYDNVFIRPWNTCYIVVPPPAQMTVVSGRPVAVGDAVTVYIPNRDGGYTAVVLTRRHDGYTGPQGEFYPGNPTVAQLQVFYGS